MTALPSFIELMATLGIEDQSAATQSRSPTSPQFAVARSRSPSVSSSSRSSPRLSPTRRTITHDGHTAKSNSITSLRELNEDRRASLTRGSARYSPYSPVFDRYSGMQPHPHSPTTHRSRAASRSSLHRRSLSQGLDIEPLSISISSYVRRRTPQSSPVSPLFVSYSNGMDRPVAEVDYSIAPSVPSLPVLLPPMSATSFTFNLSRSPSPVQEATDYAEEAQQDVEVDYYRHSHTGVRVSAVPSHARMTEH